MDRRQWKALNRREHDNRRQILIFMMLVLTAVALILR